MPHRFQIGDIVKLIKNDGAARAGATAVVTDYHSDYMYIKWIRNDLSANKNDGRYYEYMLFILHINENSTEDMCKYYHAITQDIS
jgi:hypothetical protein